MVPSAMVCDRMLRGMEDETGREMLKAWVQDLWMDAPPEESAHSVCLHLVEQAYIRSIDGEGNSAVDTSIGIVRALTHLLWKLIVKPFVPRTKLGKGEQVDAVVDVDHDEMICRVAGALRRISATHKDERVSLALVRGITKLFAGGKKRSAHNCEKDRSELSMRRLLHIPELGPMCM